MEADGLPSIRAKFPKTRRLSGDIAFARVFGAKCSASNRHLVVYIRENGLPYARLGLSVGRRLGGAVERNRLKRLIREAFRMEAAALPGGFDLVCIPRPDSGATLEDYRAAIKSVTARALARFKASPPTKTEPRA
ncbi:ribonuclease P protein component [cyanobacterium TDX16]|nr:ribonuclease P protein component [cyanobacterium TDX16]